MMEMNWDYFSERQGSAFRVESEEEPVTLTLETAQRYDQSPREGGSFRLEFHGPLEPVLQQDVHRFAADGEAFDMFIVPIRRDPTGMVYEAIFN
jgi:hypothetical protein